MEQALSSLIGTIEGPEFATEFGVVASRRQFDREILRDERVRALLTKLYADKSAQECVASRLQFLSSLRVDIRFTHPYDIAIAIYLRTLDIVATEIAEALAPTVAALPNVWWSRPLTISLLSSTRTRTESSGEAEVPGYFRGVFSLTPDVTNPNVGLAINYSESEGRFRVVPTNVGSEDETMTISNEAFDLRFGAPRTAVDVRAKGSHAEG